MPRLQLNKSSQARQATQLKTYERFLPALDLKRQQLMAERAKAVANVRQLQADVDALARRVGQEVPMLGNDEIDLDGLVRLKGYRLGSENVVGTGVPTLEHIDVDVWPYDLMTKPHWVDDVARLLHDMIEARVRVRVAQRRVAILNQAVTKITQRVNLFEKVLIPDTRANIKRIRIYLNDEEMAAVVRSKIAKKKREKQKRASA